MKTRAGVTAGCAALLLCLPGAARAQVFDGLTLYNSLYSQTTKLVGNSGQTVNSWNCATTVAYMPYLMPDSTLWRPGVYSGASMRGGVYGGLIERYNWDGDIVQSFIWSGPNHQQHHDIEPMPNGNVLVLAWERKTQAEARAMGRVNISSEMWPDAIVEYDPAGDSVVWEWRVWEHVIQDVDSTKPNYGVVREHPERIDINLGTLFMYGDWIHANIVSYSEERDEIIFSSRFLCEIYVIDHSTTTEEARGSTGGRHCKGGDIVYRWGNPQNYRRGDATDQHFYVVHGAHWIKPGLEGAGNILVFNNGDRPGTANDYSSVEEITPPLDSNDHYHIHPDSAFGPDGPSWTYSNPGTLYSPNMSGAYRLPNGNTIICEAVSGRVTEVTRYGDVVWQYNAGNWTGRAMKYPRDFASGVEEERPAPHASRPKPAATIARGRLFLPEAGGRTELLDATGRRVLNLAPGDGDVSRLAPGVYFIRAAGQRPVTTRVLVTR